MINSLPLVMDKQLNLLMSKPLKPTIPLTVMMEAMSLLFTSDMTVPSISIKEQSMESLIGSLIWVAFSHR